MPEMFWQWYKLNVRSDISFCRIKYFALNLQYVRFFRFKSDHNFPLFEQQIVFSRMDVLAVNLSIEIRLSRILNTCGLRSAEYPSFRALRVVAKLGSWLLY